MSKSRRQKHYSIGFLLSLAAGFGFVVFILWSSILFHQLSYVTAQRSLLRPARFYSDVFALHPGTAITPEEITHKLKQRGYGEIDVAPEPGQFQRTSPDSLAVNFRPFTAPDGRSTAGLTRFGFSEGKLERISAEGADDLQEVLLEPVPLGDASRAGVENRPWIALQDIPSLLKQGVIASEDRHFHEHHGISPRAVGRAILINLRRGGVRQGGSTLTQQLIKNAFLTHKRTFRRKFTEASLALAMEARYSKDQILEMYLNQIYLGQHRGRGLYGVEDASRAFFGKPVAKLSMDECALLTGLIPSPNTNNPRLYPDRARHRRNLALNIWRKADLITEAEWTLAKAAPIKLAPLTSLGGGDYYLTYVQDLLERSFGGPALDNQGYRIYTCMDPDLQKTAEQALSQQKLDAALVAMDPYLGYVRALVGGRNFASAPFNRAVLAKRQPGSTFKPILYAAALEAKAVTLATVLEDAPIKLEEYGQIWEPQNYDGLFRGTTTVRDALIYSMNIPSVHVMEKVGAGPVVDLAKNLGIQSELRPVPSLALGTSEVTPVEMTAAYAAFGNGGFAVKPIFIRWVTDAEGNILESGLPDTQRALSPETASLVTSVLRDVMDIGTGRSSRRLGFSAPAAGKTGTTDNFMDAWFIGYTPKMLCGVWVGNDKPTSLGKGAAALALPIWVKFMAAAQGSDIFTDFSRNAGVAEIAIDPDSGLLARAGCPDQKMELFLRGTEPKDFCPMHDPGVKGLFGRFLNWMRKDGTQ